LAEGLRQLAWAEQRLGNREEALEAAGRAAETRPEVATYAITLGELQLGADRPEAAMETFRQALYLLARSSGPARVRARVYAKIGLAEEALGHTWRACDSYERALALDPEEATASRRLADLEGFPHPGTGRGRR
jgi:tetratricopeptide (TPR) repeat protein